MPFNKTRFWLPRCLAVRSVAPAVLVAGVVCCVPAVPCPAQDVVYISLRSGVKATHDPVLLGDVADVLTDDDELQRKLTALDVSDAPTDGQTVEITKLQVEVRLRLAGVETAVFRVVGAAATEIRSSSASLPNLPETIARPIRASLDLRVKQQLTLELAELWRVPPDRIEAKLLRALPASGDLDLALIDAVEVDVPALQKPGNIRPRVSLFAGGRLLDTWVISAEALVIYDVVVVAQTINKGDVISSANVTVAQRPMRYTGLSATIEAAMGRAARQTLQPGHVIRTHDLLQQQLRNQSLIKPRDAVRLVVRKGGLQVVVADAVALQPGNPGDLIRVRNPRSKQVVVGRVDETGEVRVAL